MSQNRSSNIRKIVTTANKLSPEAAAAAFRIEEMENSLKENSYFTKYKDSLGTLKKNDPIEYLRRLDKLAQYTQAVSEAKKKEIQENNQSAGMVGTSETENEPTKPITEEEKQLEQALHGSEKAPTGLPFDLKKLLKIEMMKEKTTKEVEEIWKMYFSTRNSICAIIPKKKYVQISTLATLCPQFIYPVPRDEGYEMFLGQWSDNMIFFTSLIYYQKHGEHATPQVSMHHYPNLQESHDIVLMAAKVDENQISVQDTQFLAYLVELFYGTDEGDLVRKFRYKPSEFRHEEVVERIEKMINSSLARPPIPNQSKGTVKRDARQKSSK